ncbi:MAG: c-type cytochrome, partial [Planctomycetaceae bacterium]|nr:c-type cytochrome [Planctomycetaceae bacterium]
AGWISRSLKRPDEYLDMPPVIAAFGRGSPTGVVCYRHTQFPEKYRNALFVLDWTYGRVMALPLERDGSVWKTAPEEFITAVGQFGFAPTDAAVGPDGALYVSVGGRGTRGGVYRIVWNAAASPSVTPDELTQCLTADDPLSSWSRRAWEPVAMRLGRTVFEQAAQDGRRPEAQRVRAIEILTEKFGGIDPNLAARLSQIPSPLVRARAAWALGQHSEAPPDVRVMGRFLRDPDPLVVRAALEGFLRLPPAGVVPQAEAIAPLLASSDRFVRSTAARVLAQAPEATFHEMAETAVRFGWQAAISVAWASALRNGKFDVYAVDIGRRILEGNQPVEVKRDAARLIQIGLGDVGPTKGVDPVFDGYHCLVDLSDQTAALDPLRTVLTRIYPTGDARLDHELGRVIAMLKIDDEDLFAKVLAQVTGASDPVDDIHQLIVAARMPTARTPEQRDRIARTLVGLDGKIESRDLKRDSNWEDRIVELFVSQVDRDAELLQAVLSQPDLGAPGHVPFALAAEDDQIETVIDRFVRRIADDPEYPWTNDIVFLLSESRQPAVRDMLRAKADDFTVRSSVLISLAERPQPQDRALLISGLDTPDVGVLDKVTKALETFEPNDGAVEQVALVRTLRRLDPSPQEREIQDAVVRQLQRNTSKDFGYKLGQPASNRQSAAIAEWSAWAAAEFPDEWSRQTGASTEDLVELHTRLDSVDWTNGNAARGATLFQKRSCAQCHGGRAALGPDLTGAAGRFSRLDLFTAIVLPDRDVSPRYQTTLIATQDGQVHTGLVIYESVDGLVLRTSTNQTLRIETADIEERRRLTTSLMPSGLLKDLHDADLADLYAYLQTLGAKPLTADGRTSGQGE